MSPRRVLIVSFSYWPMANARAFRWTALAEDWARKGIEVNVVCAWIPGRPRHEEVNGVRIHRAGSGLVERMRAMLATRRGAEAAPDSVTSRKRPRRGIAVSVAAFINERVWRKLYWPDTSCLWFFSALRETRRIARASGCDALVSVSPTFTAVAVGRRARAQLPGGARWLIDLGDPFSFAVDAPPNNLALYRALNISFERRCFATADAVTVTTPATQARYAAFFRASAEKIHVIPPLLSTPAEAATHTEHRHEGHRARLVFLGTLYGAIRRPDFLLKLFRKLLVSPAGPQLELHFFGDIRDCGPSFAPYTDLLGDRIQLHGTVPRKTAVEAMASASILINIGNVTTYQLPSKVVEYAATGKPILNIASNEGDSSAAFLAGYPLHATLIEQPEGPTQTDVDRTLTLLARSGEAIDRATLDAFLAPSTLGVVSTTYLRLLLGNKSTTGFAA